MSTSQTQIALLRGINVGGRNRLPMKELTVIIEGMGCAEVRTYIQSGNVVFKAPADTVKALVDELPAKIEEDFGFAPPIITRSARQLRAVHRANPFHDGEFEPKLLHVLFLDKKPRAARVQALDPERSLPDTFEVKGREIYANYRGGAHKTRLTYAYFEKNLGVTATARNWNTINRLLAML